MSPKIIKLMKILNINQQLFHYFFKVGQAIIASNIELDAPKHIFLMIFMLLDRRNPNSFFKVLLFLLLLF